MFVTALALLALSAAGVAHAQPASQSPVGTEVRSDDGTVVLGRVTSVERDRSGRIVSVAIPGLEPAEAPRDNNARVASREDDDEAVSQVSYQTRDPFGGVRPRRVALR